MGGKSVQNQIRDSMIYGIKHGVDDVVGTAHKGGRGREEFTIE